jgi:hypothetical protein
MHAPNDYFKKTGTDAFTDGGTATKIEEVLGLLESGLATCGYGGTGVIHLNPRQASQILNGSCCGFEFDPGANTIHTAMGNLVVIGGGYGAKWDTASKPGIVDPANPNAPVTVNHATDDWTHAYATGPVQVRLTDPEVTATFDRKTNKHTIVAERFAAATWGSCCRVEVTTP